MAAEKESARDPGPGMQVSRAGKGDTKREVDDPAKAGGHKEKVEQAQPDGGDLVNESDDPIGKTETEQGRHDEAD